MRLFSRTGLFVASVVVLAVLAGVALWPYLNPAAALVRVYFIRSEPTEFVLVPVDVRVKKADRTPEKAIELLAAGPPSGSGLMPSLPEGASLRSVSVQNGLARADFSSELATNFNGGSRIEELTIYAIVNTLTEFEEIDRVLILVDGEKVETIGGHLSAERTFERDLGMVLGAE